ncbi:CAAX amino terminal protease self- immunity [Peptococcaceae bacterium CEB3]|nr:CAAX amino terminal protease self- immunity [Peptococcaceae bacterium CEB3]
MNRLIKLFRTDRSYREEVSKYGISDGLLALGVFAALMVLYYFAGVYQATKKIYLGVPVNLLFIALCVFLAVIRKDGIRSLGFKRKQAAKSVLTGLALGILIVLVDAVVSLAHGSRLAPFGTIVWRFFYYLMIIALMEEVVFRGYIQSRLFGLVRNNVAATILAAIMFVLMHIPYQMGAAGVNWLTFCQNNGIWFVFLFMWHMVFTYLFRKYNSVFAPTLMHALMDWGNILFIG